jgi:outer membrane protein assembly factor BamB
MNKHITHFLLLLSVSLALALGILATPLTTFAQYSQHPLANQTDLSSQAITSAPIIKLSRTSGPPTTRVTVSGTSFGSNENVSITIDSTPIGSTRTNRSGTFSTAITIPGYVSPGNFVVQATGKTSQRSAQATFLVQTNWSMFGDNARHSHFNPYENTIGTGNVVKLSNGWLFHTGSVVGSSPAVVNGIVYVGSNDGNVYAIDTTTGTKVWSYSIGFGIVQTSPAVVNGVVYVGESIDAMSANLYALDAKTGVKLWSFTTGGSIDSSPTVMHGNVYFGSGDGVYALNAKTGAKLWSSAIRGTYSSPAVDEGIVYIGSGDGNVYALNAQSGAKLWSFTTGGSIDSSPAVANHIVYIGAADGMVYALNAKTGAKLWSAATGGIDYSSPAVAYGVVYIGSSDGNVYAFNAKTGSKVWSSNIGSFIEASPTVANGLVYIGAQDNSLSILNASTGAKLWSTALGNSLYLMGLSSSPTVVNGVVYIGSRDGNVYAFCMCG